MRLFPLAVDIYYLEGGFVDFDWAKLDVAPLFASKLSKKGRFHRWIKPVACGTRQKSLRRLSSVELSLRECWLVSGSFWVGASNQLESGNWLQDSGCRRQARWFVGWCLHFKCIFDSDLPILAFLMRVTNSYSGRCCATLFASRCWWTQASTKTCKCRN